jgi:hypothetical protein
MRSSAWLDAGRRSRKSGRSGRQSTACTTLKIAAFTPMPSAIVMTTTSE